MWYKIKKIYIGTQQVRPATYEYSYDFMWKNMTQVANDGRQWTSWWNIDSNGLYRNAWNNPIYIQPSWMWTALSNATKLTIKIWYYVTKWTWTRDIWCSINSTSWYSEPRFWLYCWWLSSANSAYHPWSSWPQYEFSYSYTWSTVFTEVWDFVNKTLTISSTDGNTITPNTFTLTDSMIATLKTHTYISIMQNWTYSKMQSIDIKIK